MSKVNYNIVIYSSNINRNVGLTRGIYFLQIRSFCFDISTWQAHFVTKSDSLRLHQEKLLAEKEISLTPGKIGLKFLNRTCRVKFNKNA